MSYGQNAVYFFDNSLVTILLLGIRLLWIIFIVSIAAGIVLEAKKREWNKLGLSFIQQTNRYHNPHNYLCTYCGQKLNFEWQYCPGCSSPINSKSGVSEIEVASQELSNQKKSRKRKPSGNESK